MTELVDVPGAPVAAPQGTPLGLPIGAGRSPARLEPAQRRLRALVGGHVVIDTTEAALLFEAGHHPRYVVPRPVLHGRLVGPSAAGHTTVWSLAVGDEVRAAAALTWPAGLPGLPQVRDYLHVVWGSVDAWLEEDREVFYAPRDPYRHVEVLPSSRHLVVQVGGRFLVDTHQPALVLETGLPPRWYAPRSGADWSLLVPSPTLTRCQYKGVARYWHVRTPDGVHQDVAWSYELTTPDQPHLAQLLAIRDDVPGMRTTVDGTVLTPRRPDATWMNPSMHHESRSIPPTLPR